ncbi:hypothetical protein TTHERM_001031324 (macronuclear) [Tetrahymena thermophila SB210]|uniref:Uncharacterized protein n=1 Tax=Tetrahymena thermophila (strain SB210) TaxID=312017 RepID=W7XKY3_TETTS|nr:hypothetical protein TTHERM_001031324 [Tetrahymena thermophila SB210]EWS75339.1 hypothetical protein TTHERM_001031324 [Tetrahymena thermophila SB210]|eukprot:XP_012652128.1 hypothetical protein TTHERM_001031324 [Tetrahymena thermophila SB210]
MKKICQIIRFFNNQLNQVRKKENQAQLKEEQIKLIKRALMVQINFYNQKYQNPKQINNKSKSQQQKMKKKYKIIKNEQSIIKNQKLKLSSNYQKMFVQKTINEQ